MPMSRLLAGTSVTSRPADDDPAAVDLLEAGQRPQRRRLAAPRRAEQRDQRAGRDVEGEPVERLHLTVGAVQVLEPDGAAGGAPVLTRGDGLDGHGVSSRRAGVTARTGWLRRRPPRRRARERQHEQQGEREQQRGQGDRHRDAGVPLAEQVDRHLHVGAAEQVRDGELAEHERHRQERRRQDGAADVRQHDPGDHRAPTRAQAAGRLGEGPDVDRLQPRVERAVGVREHEHGVREAQRQRRGPEEVRDPRVDRRQPDDEHDRGHDQRQQAEELQRAAQPRAAAAGPRSSWARAARA